MTKSGEKAANEITVEAKRKAAQLSISVCDVLAGMLAEAKAAGDQGD